MDHFSIVSAICRTSMKNPTNALTTHIKKLIKALEKDNLLDQSNSLREIIDGYNVESEIKPSRITLSKFALSGESLPKGIKPPVDKESGNYLAQITYPSELDHPVFDPNLESSINYLLDEWENADQLQTQGIMPAYSLMLFGAPGTGKTYLATYLASKLKLPLITAKLDGLLSSFLGTTARNISNLFLFANRYKCILLLDEFDAIAKLRDDPNELGELKRVVNTLLQCLDERSKLGYTIAITNHETLLDPAIWRRFDLRIEIPKPSFDIRQEIIKNYDNSKVPLSDLEIKFLTWLSADYSGSDINKLLGFLNRRRVILKSEYNFITSIKEFITLNANLTNPEISKIINSNELELVKFLKNDTTFKLTQAEMAKLFNTNQSSISRLLHK